MEALLHAAAALPVPGSAHRSEMAGAQRPRCVAQVAKVRDCGVLGDNLTALHARVDGKISAVVHQRDGENGRDHTNQVSPFTVSLLTRSFFYTTRMQTLGLYTRMPPLLFHFRFFSMLHVRGHARYRSLRARRFYMEVVARRHWAVTEIARFIRGNAAKRLAMNKLETHLWKMHSKLAQERFEFENSELIKVGSS